MISMYKGKFNRYIRNLIKEALEGRPYPDTDTKILNQNSNGRKIIAMVIYYNSRHIINCCLYATGGNKMPNVFIDDKFYVTENTDGTLKKVYHGEIELNGQELPINTFGPLLWNIGLRN